MMNWFYKICEMVGENPKREGLIETPKRIAKSYEFLLSGYNQDPKKMIKILQITANRLTDHISQVVTYFGFIFNNFCYI